MFAKQNEQVKLICISILGPPLQLNLEVKQYMAYNSDMYQDFLQTICLHPKTFNDRKKYTLCKDSIALCRYTAAAPHMSMSVRALFPVFPALFQP